MLVSCDKFRCSKKRGRANGREGRREKPRISYKEADDDEDLVLDDAVDNQDAMETDEEHKSQTKSRKAPKSKARQKDTDAKSVQGTKESTKRTRKGPSTHSRHGSGAIQTGIEGEDHQANHPSSNAPEKPKSVLANMQPKPTPKPSSEDGVSSLALDDASSIQMDGLKPTPAKPKKARRSRKSGAANDGGKYVPPKDEEGSSESEDSEDRPKRKRRKAA